MFLTGTICTVGSALAIRHNHAYCPSSRHPLFRCVAHPVTIITPDPKLGEKLPSLGTTELIPEEPANEDYGQGDRADIQHRREQERDVRGATKTIAQLALEMSHVHRLADLIKEKADLLKELAMRRKSYQDEVKESAKGKSTAASSAPKKTENHRSACLCG